LAASDTHFLTMLLKRSSDSVSVSALLPGDTDLKLCSQTENFTLAPLVFAALWQWRFLVVFAFMCCNWKGRSWTFGWTWDRFGAGILGRRKRRCIWGLGKMERNWTSCF